MQRFRAYLQRRNYAAHTVDSYLLDLELFCQDIDGPLSQISFRDVNTFAKMVERCTALAHRQLNLRSQRFGLVSGATNPKVV